MSNQQLALDLWARLGSEGKAPNELMNAAKVLPFYSVALEPWLTRMQKTYLQNLAQRGAHFKLVIAPYGGGKTHFLMAVGARALTQGFATSYIGCSAGVNLAHSFDVYQAFIKNLHIPGNDKPGVLALLRYCLHNKQEQIQALHAPDPEAAFDVWLQEIAQEEYPEPAFGRVLAAALRHQWQPEYAPAGDAALRWLRGEIDTLTRGEREALRLARIPQRAQSELGKNLLFSLITFLKEIGLMGVVILFDEVETLFNVRGQALQRILAAMRVVLDQASGFTENAPLFGLFAAVPDVVEHLARYPALEQRLAVRGAPFEEGNDFAPQIHLDKIEAPLPLLTELGKKLLALGKVARSHQFDAALQEQNIKNLAKVATDFSLEIDARRLFVKSCVNILDLQVHQGERAFALEELQDRYRGYWDELKRREQEQEGSEP